MTNTYGNYSAFIALKDGVWSFIPDAAITKGSPVNCTTNGSDLAGIKVSEAGADTAYIGFAEEAAIADSDPKTIRVITRFRAIVKVTVSAAVSAGDLLVPAGSDKMKKIAETTTAAAVLLALKTAGAIALQSASADGDIIAAGLL